MSKKRHLNHGPEGSVSCSGKPITLKGERVAKFTRKSAWAVLALVATLGDDVSTARTKDELFEQSPISAAANTVPPKPYESPDANWMVDVQLPTMGKIVPGAEDLLDRLPKGVDRERLVQFDAQCRQWFAEAERDLSELEGGEARQRRIFDYLERVINAYAQAVGVKWTGRMEMGSDQFVIQMQKVNSILLPFGNYMHAEYNPSDGARMTLYRANRQASTTFGGQKVPLLYLTDGPSLRSVPRSEKAYFNGMYNPQSGIAYFDENGSVYQFKKMIGHHRVRCESQKIVPRTLNLAKAKEGWIRDFETHEAAHSYFNQRIPYNPNVGLDLRGKVAIPMGRYELPAILFATSSQAQLHELFANAIGLMESGGSAVLAAHSIATTRVTGEEMVNYKLASDVLFFEVMNCPDLDEPLRSQIKSELAQAQKVDLNKMAVAIDRLSDESLHRIGKRMAKLALYLTQE